MSANYFPLEKVDSFSKKHNADMSAKEMEHSSNAILELQDNGGTLEEKEI